MSLGENIKHRRENAKITQSELAEAVSVAQSMVAQIERGTKVPSAYLMRDIARYFGCTVDELLRNTESEKE